MLSAAPKTARGTSTNREPKRRPALDSNGQPRQILEVGGAELAAARVRGSGRVGGVARGACGQLAAAVREPGRARAEIEAFLRSFVRPRGVEQPATPLLADAIESVHRAGG